MSKIDMDGLHACPIGRSVGPDGKHHGEQSRLRRRAARARELGPSRLLVRALGARG